MKALLVDDEEHCRVNLSFLIRKYCPEILEIETASSVNNALSILKTYSPNIIFLDVQMPKQDGFHLLKLTDTSNISIVFVTAHDEFAMRAIKFGPTAFLLKPVDINKLKEAVGISLKTSQYKTQNSKAYNQAIKDLTNSLETRKIPDRICLSHSTKLEIVNIKDIVMISSDSYYSTFQLSNGSKITMAKTLKIYEEIVGELFIRVHRSFLVNIIHIKEYTFDDGKLKLSNGTVVPVSRRKSSELVTRLKYSR